MSGVMVKTGVQLRHMILIYSLQQSPIKSFVEDSQFQQSDYVSDVLLSSDFKFYDSFTLKAILGATNLTHKFQDNYVSADNLSIPDFYDVSNGTGSLGGRYAGYDGTNSTWGAVANAEEYINLWFLWRFYLGV